MAPKKPLKTGGKAGGRAGRPSGPIAGTQDKTARVPSSWNARSVDPTNQRGAGQRPTGGMAGGRAGKPSGSIARPAAKPAAKPTAPATTTPRARTTTSYGPPASQIKFQGAGQNSLLSNLRNAATKVTSTVKRAQGGAIKVGKFGGKLLGPVAVASDAFVTAKNVFNPKDNIIHDLGNLGIAVENAISGKDSGRRYSGNSPVAKAGNIKRGLKKLSGKGAAPAAPSKYGTRFKNMNSGASAAKGAKPAASTSKSAGARDAAMIKAKGIKGSPVVGPKTASAPARMSAPAARSSAPSAPRAAAPKASAPKASAPKASAPSGPARMSASTYNRMSGNYGTSRSNNPLMADFKDSLPSKAADPDAGYSPKTKVSSEGIKGAPTDVTKLAFSNPKLSAERTRKIKRG